MPSHRESFVSKKALAIALSIALAGPLLSGCSGKEEREAKYLQRAEEYLTKKDYDKARIEAKNVLQINANNAQAHFIVAQIAESEKNWQQMYAELNAAIQYDPQFLKAHVKLAQFLAAANQLEKAAEQAEKVKAIDPNNADYYSIQASISARKNKPEEAIQLAEKSLSMEPGNLGASALLAAMYAEKDPAKAEQVLTASIKTNPDEYDLQTMLASLMRNRISPKKPLR